ncbi:MAG: hypothetical protein R8K47_03435 [Mariprofundaceae bacterium]
MTFGGFVAILLATLAGIGTLIVAALYQTPATEALALLTWGALLTATVAWRFRPRMGHRRNAA